MDAIGKAYGGELLDWLLDSDPSVVAQVERDLMDAPEAELRRSQAAVSGGPWVRELMGRRGGNGHWGRDAYGPKWTCTHYVLYELMQLGMPRDSPECAQSRDLLLGYPAGADGGINYARTVEHSDACINGMILSIACYFPSPAEQLRGIVDYLLKVRMADGGWNCEYLHGARHSSLHTTIAVLEGFETYAAGGYRYRLGEIETAIGGAIEFILRHSLYKSDKTGETIKDEFFKFCFPVRWKYDILRCLDLFQKYGVPYDERMGEALDAVEAAKGAKGRWKARSQPGATYFVMEAPGAESRWNTLRALRVLRRYRR